ncbi:hypothetical protein [Burkholderia cepacia]|uniref:hypothetical protein n=1 Tax=Burkholderia cepacia TaxID=292 RepID=UPI0015771F0D|nr:hypothetical protein [Burkholderia cepacia]
MAQLVDRHNAFKRFYKDSKVKFDGFFQNDEAENEIEKHYSFYAVPGGSNGALDDRVVEVFYGNRALGATQQLAFGANGLPTVKRVTTVESGAQLISERTDAGTVLVTIYPATTA